MIPLRPARIFRSRWAALLWAAGVIWTAVTFVGFGTSKHGDRARPAAVTDATDAAVSNDDLAVLRNVIGGE